MSYDTPSPLASDEPLAASSLTAEDQSHLKVLSILWFVAAGLMALGAPCGLLYAGMGLLAALGGGSEEGAIIGGIVFAGIGIFVILLTLGLAFLAFLTGDGLRKQKRLILIYIIAGLACTSVPLGTLLGVFTFVVLSRPTVKAAFARQANPARV